MKNFWKNLKFLGVCLFKAVVLVYLLFSCFFVMVISRDIVDLQIEQQITRAYFDKIVTTHYKMIEKLVESDKNLIQNDRELIELDTKFVKDISDLYKGQKTTFEILTEFPKIIKENLSEYFLPPSYEKLREANYLLHNFSEGAQTSGTLIKLNNKFYILTCAHLLKRKAEFILAENTISKNMYPITLKKIDKKNDLALFKININNFKKDEKLSYLEISKIAPKVGDKIYVIGNPGHYEDLLTSGIIAKKKKNKYIITAPIYFGNSGGAVIYNRKIIGIVSMISIQFEIDYHNIGEETWWLDPSFPYQISVQYGIATDLETIKDFLKDIK